MLNIVYRKAQIKDLDKIEILIKSAIYEMESHNIMQWDDLYPVKEDFACQHPGADNSHGGDKGIHKGDGGVGKSIQQEIDDSEKGKGDQSGQGSLGQGETGHRELPRGILSFPFKPEIPPVNAHAGVIELQSHIGIKAGIEEDEDI